MNLDFIRNPALKFKNFFYQSIIQILAKSDYKITAIESLLDSKLYADKHYQLDALGMLLESEELADASNLDVVANYAAYERNSWVAGLAESVPAGAKVLDAGAGQCQYKALFDHTNYFSQDFAQYEGSGEGPLKETWEYVSLDYISDITDIPVRDNTFDVVLCTEVLEHVPDPISTIKELSRVLMPGGKLFISAPLNSGVHQEPYHFYGGFSRYFYLEYFEKYGIALDKITPLGGHLKMTAQELLRASRMLQESGQLSELDKMVMNDWIPLKLHKLDSTFFTEQFTVGYLVEGTKNAE